MSGEKNRDTLPQAESKPRLRVSPKFARVYRDIALIFFNAALLVLFVGGIVFLVSHLKRKEKPQNPLDKYGSAKLRAAYPDRSREEIASLLNETWSRPLTYEPYTQFRESPHQGKYVNVAEAGYRKVENQGPWPPAKDNLNVFVFGGSTTFGYGVADSETIPSVLQRKLRASYGARVCVYNFGCAFYYSTQERILFSNLLASGAVPDIAVFIDGLNEFGYRKDVPEFSAHLTQALNEYFYGRKKAPKKPKPSPNAPKAPGDAKQEATDQEDALRICRRYLHNRDLIEAMAGGYGVKTLFVWQPVPMYKYDLKYHLFRADLSSGQDFTHRGYQTMAELRQTNGPPTNELWLADMQETAREPLYVDAVHYSPRMCDRIAGGIEKFLRQRGFIGPSPKR